MEEKKRILAYKIVWGILFVLSLVGFIVNLIIASIYSLMFPITFCCLVITLFGLIYSFRMVVRQYNYKGREILVYAGLFKYCVKKDGEYVDKQWRVRYLYACNDFACRIDQDTVLNISIGCWGNIKINTV